MELKYDISELKDSIGEVLVIIIPEVCRKTMVGLQRRLWACVQSGGQYFENLFEVANLQH